MYSQKIRINVILVSHHISQVVYLRRFYDANEIVQRDI